MSTLPLDTLVWLPEPAHPSGPLTARILAMLEDYVGAGMTAKVRVDIAVRVREEIAAAAEGHMVPTVEAYSPGPGPRIEAWCLRCRRVHDYEPAACTNCGFSPLYRRVYDARELDILELRFASPRLVSAELRELLANQDVHVGHTSGRLSFGRPPGRVG